MAKEQPTERKRQAPADQLKGVCVTWEGGSGRVVSLMADLNLGSMSLETSNPPALGTILDLQFDSPGQEIRARAVVRRIVPAQGMDVEFMGMGMDDRARLRALLRMAEKSKQRGKTEEAAEVEPGERGSGEVGPGEVGPGEDVAPSVALVHQTAIEIPAKLADAASWPGRRERRTHLRHLSAGTVKLVDVASREQFKGHLVNIGREGCHVKADGIVPVGATVQVSITVDKELFSAGARVVYGISSNGLGLLFTKMEPESVELLEKWLGTLLENAWLVASRRRSQRMTLAVPVEIRGQDTQGERFAEPTLTLRISPGGAAVLLSAKVTKGQRLTLLNPRTKSEVECAIVHIVKAAGGKQEVGLSFTLPNPAFWKVAFPPSDWSPRHLDAKRSQ
jgi:hypothetical protein